jgi:membrane associated rhomboid family serine protease
VIPLRDVIPSRAFPVVSVTLVGLNTATFLCQQLLAPDARTALVSQFGLTPQAVAWWAPLTAMFLHSDWIQFGCNTTALWLFGENVEDRMGRGRMLAFYVLAGVLTAFVHAWTGPAAAAAPAVGASGAVAGVLGAYFRLFPRSRVLTFVPVPGAGPLMELPAASFLGFWGVGLVLSALLQLTRAGAGAATGWSFASCAVGFLAGALLIRVFRREERMRVEWWHEPAPRTGR